jgi:transcription antitermination factor NusG
MSPVTDGAKLHLGSEGEEFISSPKGMARGENQPAAALGFALGQHERHWYVVHTSSRHEKTVARQLGECQIEFFLPLYHSVRRWKDRSKQLDLPLFPGYVFTKVTPRQRMRVLSFPGVARFVSFGVQAVTVPENEIETLREGLDQGVYAEPHSFLQIGRKVRVIRGPLAGMEGFLSRKKDRLRVVISVNAIMRSIAVEVDAADVVSAS